MIKDTAYSRSLTNTPSAISIIYAPGDFTNGSVAGNVGTVTPLKVGKVTLKMSVGTVVRLIENHFVSLIGVTEIIAEEGLLSIQDASSIFIRWIELFDKELYAATVGYGTGYKYSTVSASIQEYIEIGLLDFIRNSDFNNPKEFISQSGVKVIQSETERIELFDKYRFQQTIPTEIEDFVLYIAGLLVTGFTAVDIDSFSLEGNRRSEIDERGMETLIPVGTIERIEE